MKYSPIKRDVSKYRFALPNNIWTRNLKAPAFAVLAYLQYRHCRRFSSVITLVELAERIRMSIETAKACVETLINHKLLTVDLVPILPNIKGGKFFTVPDEVFYLELGHGAITVYAYLLCCEDRRLERIRSIGFSPAPACNETPARAGKPRVTTCGPLCALLGGRADPCPSQRVWPDLGRCSPFFGESTLPFRALCGGRRV